jgi:hypothetical protein
LGWFFAVAVPLISVPLLAWVWPGEERPHRLFGTALQLLGLVLVFWQLGQNLELFGRGGLLGPVRGWFDRARGILRPPITGSMNFALEMTVKAEGSVLPPLEGMERRVALLEVEVTAMRTAVDELRASLGRRTDELEVRISETFVKIEQLGSKLESFAVGSPGVAIMGGVWTLAGTAISGFAQEVAWMFGPAGLLALST